MYVCACIAYVHASVNSYSFLLNQLVFHANHTLDWVSNEKETYRKIFGEGFLWAECPWCLYILPNQQRESTDVPVICYGFKGLVVC